MPETGRRMDVSQVTHDGTTGALTEATAAAAAAAAAAETKHPVVAGRNGDNGGSGNAGMTMAGQDETGKRDGLGGYAVEPNRGEGDEV